MMTGLKAVKIFNELGYSVSADDNAEQGILQILVDIAKKVAAIEQRLNEHKRRRCRVEPWAGTNHGI